MATAESTIRASEFMNEPFVDFSTAENKRAMEAALKKVESEFGREYPMYIGGEKIITTAKMTSINPSHPKQVIGVFQTATAEHAKLAVEAATAGSGRSRRTSRSTRPTDEPGKQSFAIAAVKRGRQELESYKHSERR